MSAPVREDKPIEFILDKLVGAPRESFLNKWKRWINELIMKYEVDPSDIGYDPDMIEDFLLEWCHGLTQSECYDRINIEIQDHRRKTVIDESSSEIDQLIDAHFSNPIKICDMLEMEDQDCKALLEIKKNPCLDGEKAKSIIRHYIVMMYKANVGEDPTEEDLKQIDEEATNLVKELRIRLGEKCVDWTLMLNPVQVERKIARQRRLTEFIKKDVEKELAPAPRVEEKPKIIVGAEITARAVGEVEGQKPKPQPPAPTPIPQQPPAPVKPPTREEAGKIPEPYELPQSENIDLNEFTALASTRTFPDLISVELFARSLGYRMLHLHRRCLYYLLGSIFGNDYYVINPTPYVAYNIRKHGNVYLFHVWRGLQAQVVVDHANRVVVIYECAKI